MSFVKKICSLLIILLLLVSIYKDLTKRTPLEYTEDNLKLVKSTIETNDFHVIKIKVEQGDTLLSITERLNGPKLVEINIPIIIEDFKYLNNSADPYHLLIDAFYLFPLYSID